MFPSPPYPPPPPPPLTPGEAQEVAVSSGQQVTTGAARTKWHHHKDVLREVKQVVADRDKAIEDKKQAEYERGMWEKDCHRARKIMGVNNEKHNRREVSWAAG